MRYNIKMRNEYLLLFQFILIISLVETISLGMMKQSTYSNGNNSKYELSIGIIGYMIIAYFLWKSLFYEGVGMVNLLWNCITLVTGFMIGYLIFNERINRYTYGAIFFTIIAIYMAYLSEK